MYVCVCKYREKNNREVANQPSFLHFVAEVIFLAVGYLLCLTGEQTKLTEICFFVVSGEGNARPLGGQVAKGE